MKISFQPPLSIGRHNLTFGSNQTSSSEDGFPEFSLEKPTAPLTLLEQYKDAWEFTANTNTNKEHIEDET